MKGTIPLMALVKENRGKVRPVLDLQCVRFSDPALGRWDVKGEEFVVWVEASSLAIGTAQ